MRDNGRLPAPVYWMRSTGRLQGEVRRGFGAGFQPVTGSLAACAAAYWSPSQPLSVQFHGLYQSVQTSVNPRAQPACDRKVWLQGAAAQSRNRYLSRVQRATTPSHQRIFLPAPTERAW
jgi:hypothetical protein